MIDESKLNKILINKLNALKEIIIDSESAIVAYSGGIDSTLLAFLSHNILSQKSLIITVNSEFVSENELKEAKIIADKYAFNHKIINLSMFDNPETVKNPLQRCKFCKEFIFKEIIKIANENNIQTILEGSNTSDLSDYRPGYEAIKALNIKSPFIEANISKSEIREIAKMLDLPNWHKPALACLATRIAPNTQITMEVLKQIEASENYLQSLGYDDCRVRHHDKIARIELNSKDIEKFIFHHRDTVDKKFKELGYTYVCIDLKGYKMGNMNLLAVNNV